MKEFFKNIFQKTSSSLNGGSNFLKQNKLGVFSFLFSFILITTFIDITLTRNAAIKQIKRDILTWQNYLYEAGLDIAYENLRFNNILIYPLVEVDNLQIYNLSGEHLWSLKTNKASFRLSWLGGKKIKADLGEQSVFVFDEKAHIINTPENALSINVNKEFDFKNLQLEFDNLEIKDFAKIKELVFALRHHQQADAGTALYPSFESHLEIKDVAINGLVQYPLTSKITRIYTKINLRGQINPEETFAPAVENWLHQGGFLEISNLIVQWNPLILVGKGDINFNESFAPRMHLKTSSKAMFELLEDLNKNELFERKGLFVARILLSSKSFKLRDNDKYLTVTTSIDYQDGKLNLENIPIMNLNP